MTVGIVTTWFERGAAIVSKQIAEALKIEGHDCRIYARGERYAVGDPIWDTSEVHWGKRLHWAGSGKIDRKDFEDWIEREKISTLIFNEQRWWQPVVWAKAKGVRIGAYIDYYTEENVENFAVYDFLICNTKRHASAFAWHKGAHYVPWGTNVETYRPTPRVEGPVRFFHSCGWDSHRKGTDLLIKAFRLIRSEVDAQLIIHSQKDISDLIKPEDGIEVINRTVPAPGLYGLGDIYIYPSRLEGIGLTICEALASGLPVITTDEPPMSEFVENGTNGFLVPVQRRYRRGDGYYWRIAEVSVERLAEQMLEASRMTPYELAEMRERTRAMAVAERDWTKNSRRISEVVEDDLHLEFKPEISRKLNRTDLKGFKGKLDYLIEVPLARIAVSSLFRLWREFRQPQLYRK